MKVKIAVAAVICLLSITFGIALGSVYIPPADILGIISSKIFGTVQPEHIRDSTAAIVWDLRLPRALLAFLAGGALSVSGAVMQSVLRNPLASSYTLGVSSGASLGAGIIIFYGAALPFSQAAALPVFGFVSGLLAIIAAMAFASKLDGQMRNNTIILTGMIFSLFMNAVTTLMSALAREQIQRLIYWQMGSFSMKGWQAVYVLAPAVFFGTLLIIRFGGELDMMTFGEEQARTMGVSVKRAKWLLLVLSAALTGAAVAFCGVVGFIDLVAPHIVRKVFGTAHRRVIPMSALFGGAFMVLCDLAARTVVHPGELPVGAVTAIIGAPFFAYVYFSGRGGAKSRGIGKTGGAL